MDENMIMIGNHTLACSTADEIINLITDISGDSILKYFYEDCIFSKNRESANPQGIFIIPYVDEKYLNSNDQFSKEGLVSFRGIIDNKSFQIDVGPEYFLFFTSLSWTVYYWSEDFQTEILNFSVRFLSKMGSSELIFFPDKNSIAEFVSGKINTGTYEPTPINFEKYNPQPSSPFKDNCTKRQLTYNQIKQRLQIYMGIPAPRWVELVFDDQYNYLLERIPFSRRY
jgi:hypothetical protein